MSKMNTVNLYNNDGALSTEAQAFLKIKPDNLSLAEWRKIIKEFKQKLSVKDKTEFDKLKKRLDTARWKKKNPKKVKENNSNYYLTNYKKINEQTKIRKRKRRSSDPLFRLQQNIRVACNRVVKQVGLGKKPTNTFKWVGCSPEQLKAHIESLFLEGMSWDNYGTRGWHVDHVRPISSFKPEEWEQINHYTNLQPLWWHDNLSKSNKY